MELPWDKDSVVVRLRPTAMCLAGLPFSRQEVPQVTMRTVPELGAFSLPVTVAFELVPERQLRYLD